VEFVIVPLVALLASGLTLFSGFGLGTLLLPAFALFFPVEVAVGMTAVVHLLNNLFKLALLGRHADRRVVVAFGAPAAAAALAGAALLGWLMRLPSLGAWSAGGRTFEVTPVGAAVGALMLGFAALELSPRFDALAFGPRWMPVGGVLSGFLGGLSGHQGALRAAFLVRAGLGREGFIATGVACACLVDATRLSVYAGLARHEGVAANAGLVATAALAAFAGALVGARLVRAVTLRGVRLTVGAMLAAIGAGVASGAL